MPDMYLDICWGEQPFAFGEDSWPAPLIRPEPWPEDPEMERVMEGTPKIFIPDLMLARWQVAKAEFFACQREFQRLAREAGELQ